MNLEIELPVSELKAVLPGFAKIIPKSTNLPVLGCLKISADSNQVRLIGTNLDDFASINLGRNLTKNSGDVLVPYDELNKLVKGCSNSEAIHILGTKKETVIRYPIAGRMVDQKVQHVAAEEWPPMPKADVPVTPLPENFREAFRSACDCASSDASRYVLNSVYLDTENKKAHYVVATDGRHLFSANSFLFDLPKPLILPARKFLQWKGVVEDGQWKVGHKPEVKEEKGIVKEAGWIKVESAHWTFITKSIDEQYPNWRQVVPDPTRKKTLVSLPPEPVSLLLDVVLKIPVAASVCETLALEVTGKQFLIKGRRTEEDKWTVIPVEGAEVIGDPVTVHLNRSLLLKALKFGLTEIEVTDSFEPVVFLGMGKKMIVMPIRPTSVTSIAPVENERASDTR